MNSHGTGTRVVAVGLTAFLFSLANLLSAQTPLGTEFTYQGRLHESGTPVTGVYDMFFQVYSDAGGMNSLTSECYDDVPVTNGLFTVDLDFGNIADGNRLWLQVSLRPDTGSNCLEVAGAYTTLSPLVELGSSPYAHYAVKAGSAVVDLVDDADADASNEIQTLSFTSPNLTISGTGGNSVNLSALQDGTGNDWSRTGNAGTTPGTDFIGTTDGSAFQIHVNNQRVYRWEPNAESPNMVGGAYINSISGGVKGATIAGGGYLNHPNDEPNQVTGDFGTVSGGRRGVAGNLGTVGGGLRNEATGEGSTTAGGGENVATGNYSTISGGSFNEAQGSNSTVGGGSSNTASGEGSMIPGGQRNRAAGTRSFAAGYGAVVRSSDSGTFVWADDTFANFESTGTNQFLIRAAGGVGINDNNPAAALEVNGGTRDGLRIRNANGTPWALRIENDTDTTGTGNYEAGMYLTSDGFFRITNQVPSPSRMYAQLNSSGTWSAASDARLKTAMEPLNSVLEKALQLVATSYYYKDDEGNAWGDQQIGFTAQNVEASFPSLVDNASDFKTLNYSGLSVVAIAALQELKAEKDKEINRLQDHIAQQEDEIKTLASRLARLEAVIQQQ